MLDCARHTPVLGGILAASCRPFCPSSTAGAVSPLTVTDTRVRSVFLASSALPVLSWKAPSIGFVMVGPVRFAWLRRCSSAALVHRLCPGYNDVDIQRVPASSSAICTIGAPSPGHNRDKSPTARLFATRSPAAEGTAARRRHKTRWHSSGQRSPRRFGHPRSYSAILRSRLSCSRLLVANIAQRASTRSFLSRLRGGGPHTPASPQGRAGPSALSLQPSSSGMAGFSRQLHHAAPRRNPTSAPPATTVLGGQALSATQRPSWSRSKSAQ